VATKTSNGVLTWERFKNMMLLIVKVASIMLAILAVGYSGYTQLDNRVDSLEMKSAVEAVSDSAFKADVNKRLDTLDVRFYRLNKMTETILSEVRKLNDSG